MAVIDDIIIENGYKIMNLYFVFGQSIFYIYIVLLWRSCIIGHISVYFKYLSPP